MLLFSAGFTTDLPIQPHWVPCCILFQLNHALLSRIYGGPTDRRTDRQTDQHTLSYRDASREHASKKIQNTSSEYQVIHTINLEISRQILTNI